jgi:hypothetical protein
MTASRTQPDPPAGLSRGARRLWRQLTALHDFEQHELVAFGRALEWWDRSDAWIKASETATGGDRAVLVKQSLDAATMGLRHWRTLKFRDGEAARRPGRPSGDAWSPKRRALREAI